MNNKEHYADKENTLLRKNHRETSFAVSEDTNSRKHLNTPSLKIRALIFTQVSSSSLSDIGLSPLIDFSGSSLAHDICCIE